MLPSLARRFAVSPLLLKKKTSTGIPPPGYAFPRQRDKLTISRVYTHYDPKPSTEIIAATAENPTPKVHNWGPYTRKITFTVHDLRSGVFYAEYDAARKLGLQLDPRNRLLKQGEEPRMEVRQETVAGGPPPPFGMKRKESGMQLVEGEMAERLIAEAGAAEALRVNLGSGAEGREASTTSHDV